MVTSGTTASSRGTRCAACWSSAPGLLARLRQRCAQTWKHTPAHLPHFHRGGFQINASQRSSLNLHSKAEHRAGFDLQKIFVCVCECVLERERSDWGILAVCIELISFSHSFYEAKLMQRYTTPHSRVLLHMIKSLPLSLSLNYLLSFPLVLFLSHWFSLSLLLLSLSHPLFPNPPTAPTSLSDGNLPVV